MYFRVNNVVSVTNAKEHCALLKDWPQNQFWIAFWIERCEPSYLQTTEESWGKIGLGAGKIVKRTQKHNWGPGPIRVVDPLLEFFFPKISQQKAFLDPKKSEKNFFFLKLFFFKKKL